MTTAVDVGPDVQPSPRIDAPPRSLLALVALLTVVVIELVRASGPLFDMAFDRGLVQALAAAVAAYVVVPFLWRLILEAVAQRTQRSILVTGVLMFVIARFVAQTLSGGPRFFVGLMTLALGLTVLASAVSASSGHSNGAEATAAAIAAGAAASVGLQLALGTWDAFWRKTAVGRGLTSLLVVGLLSCVWFMRDAAEHEAPHPLRRVSATAFGLIVGVTAMFLANAGFASSQSDVQLGVAGPVAALGLVAAGFIVATTRLGGRSYAAKAVAVGAASFTAAVAGVFWATGAWVLIFLAIAQVAAIFVLPAILDRGAMTASERRSPVSFATAIALTGAGTIAPLLFFQLDYSSPLPFPNELVPVAAAALIGVAALSGVGNIRGERTDPPKASSSDLKLPNALLIAAGVIIVVGSVMALARSTLPDPVVPGEVITAVIWNVHFGVDPNGGIELEQTARTIEEHEPSIVLLQEVSRGWMSGGGADVSTWLADRLDMRVEFVPAADRQFGNAILTNLEFDNVARLELPYGQGPQGRSAISADLQVAGGPIRVTSVHLQNRRQHIATRLEQIETLLAAESEADIAIVAGDFNARPGEPEIVAMLDAGMISAQDVSGDPAAFTSSTTNPHHRIDWIFGRGLLFIETEVLSEASSSDHLPLVVTFTIPD